MRAILFRGEKLALVHSRKFGYYKFPGGGIERGESHHATLIREVREEIGLLLEDSSIQEFGSVYRIQKDTCAAEKIFVQENFYYTCKAKPETASQHLDDYEAAEGFTLEFILPRDAIQANRSVLGTPFAEGRDDILIDRDTRVLQSVCAELPEAKRKPKS